jgi:hypothetical protein
MHRQWECLATCVAALFVLASTIARAQTGATSSSIVGTVVDPSNAIIRGVRVSAANVETNFLRQTTSNDQGYFGLDGLPPGLYRVVIEYTGFSTEVLNAVSLGLGSTVDLKVTLRIAAVEQSITVDAQPAAIDMQSTAISATVSQQQIERLPINGRNFISFSVITPGATPDRMPVQGATATSGLSFEGQHGRSNNITVDGLDNTDDATGGVRATFSQDAVREFQVLTQSYAAEFGKASAGVVNIVTKSGTNTVAGSLFAYVRDDALNAKEHFEKFSPAGDRIDQPKAPFSQQQFGGGVGGPLRKDRAFFFGAIERLQTHANNFVTIDDQTPIEVFGRPLGTAAGLLRAAGFAVETGHVPYRITSTNALVKTDVKVGQTQTLTVRYNYGDGYHGNVEPWGGLIARSRGASLNNTDHTAVASWTSALSARALNEFRFQTATRGQQVLSLDPTCGSCTDPSAGGPTVEIPGVASAGRHRLTPQTRDNVRYELFDAFSGDAGAHLWKVGVDFDTIDHRGSSLPAYFGGRYIFSALPAIAGILPAPVTAIQAFALGLPAAYVQGYGDPNDSGVVHYLSVFGQDQWRLSNRLTVNAGIRYQTQFWQRRTYNLPGYGAFVTPSDRNDLAPRIGVAWMPTDTRTISIHGAYGIYSDYVIAGVFGAANVLNGTADGVRTLVLRFPQSVTAWTAPGRRLPEPAGPYPSSVLGIDPGLRTSYAHHMSVGVDRALPHDIVFSATAAIVRGYRQLGAIDYNPFVRELGAGRRPGDIAGQAGTSASVLQYTPYGQSWYRGLTVAVNKRLSRRLQFASSYSLSNAEDNTSDFQSTFLPENNGRGRNPEDPAGLPLSFDPMRERGPSQQDQRHRFVFSGFFMTARQVQVSAVVTVGSGVPYNVLAGVDLNGDGDGGGFPADRARRNPVDPASSVARNSGRLPGESSVDVRVSRTFSIVAGSKLETSFEVFNLFNTVNYTDVNNVFGTGSYPDQPAPHFGEFQRAAPPRQAQIALRVTF